jgi:hypothetical protein
MQIINCSDFLLIKEGSKYNPSYIYYINDIKKLVKEDWTNISVTSLSKVDERYDVKFRAGNGDYDYFQVILENKGETDFYYLEDPELFIRKFKEEFFKNTIQYVDNMVYDPKCLGDLHHIRDAKQYNL